MEMIARKFMCDFSVGDAIVTALLWFVLLIITLGLAAFVMPYYIPKNVINKTTVLSEEGKPIGRLQCEMGLGMMIGNALIWMLLTIVTLGLAYVVYVFRVQRVILNETKIVYHSE